MSESPSAPAIPRAAATVMVVRPSGDDSGFEVFMVRRHQKSSFAPDVYVFPGGTVRGDDELDEAEARAVGLDPSALHQRLRELDDPFAGRPDGGLALWVAALRELFEEAGLLLARHRDGRILDLAEPRQADRFAALRSQVQQGALPLAALARQEGLQLMADRLVYFSRWITPIVSPRRFDTRFFIADLPSSQAAAHCQIETIAGLWIEPRRALELREQGEIPMVFVTREHVKRLAEFRDVSVLLEFSRVKPTRVVRAEIDARGRPYLTPEQLRAW